MSNLSCVCRYVTTQKGHFKCIYVCVCKAGVAAIFVLVCFLLFGWVLPRLPFIREQERAARDAPNAQLADGELGSVCQVCMGAVQALSLWVLCHVTGRATPDVFQDGKPGARTVREMVRAVGVLAAATVLIYVLTLAIFPGVLAEDVSSTKLGSWCGPLGLPHCLLCCGEIFIDQPASGVCVLAKDISK